MSPFKAKSIWNTLVIWKNILNLYLGSNCPLLATVDGFYPGSTHEALNWRESIILCLIYDSKTSSVKTANKQNIHSFYFWISFNWSGIQRLVSVYDRLRLFLTFFSDDSPPFLKRSTNLWIDVFGVARLARRDLNSLKIFWDLIPI